MPKSLSIQSLPTQSNDPQSPADVATSTKEEEQLEGEEKAPPLLPRTVKAEMAERRVSQYNKRDEDERSAKRRSRSEGPHGRRRMRNSVHETSSTKTKQPKPATPGRHSMYTANHSDDEIAANLSGSESAGSDNDFQKWTKNPLLVKRSRKSDRISKAENRKSVHNLENGFSKESRGYSPSRNQKSKFQRMEANRRKRIEMTVTSDEECSPQVRISRLRQRAMMSSKLFEDDSSKNELNIIPQKNENSFVALKPEPKNEFRKSLYDVIPQSQYSEQRQGKYEESDQINNQSSRVYRQVPVQKQSEKIKTNQIKLPDFIPVQHDGIKLPIQMQSASDSKQHDKSAKNVTEARDNHRLKRDNVEINKTVDKSDLSNNVTRFKVPSESPKLRSFHEVKPSKPAPMKKAVGKIELSQRSVNTSSDDSLDDLIESNIQYLESEIESGKLKRQSGNFNNVAPNMDVVQRKVIREPIRKHSSIENELKSRLHAPISYSNPSLSPQVYVARVKTNEPIDKTPVSTHSPASKHQLDYRYISTSGSATYSPHMTRKTYDYNEDISKSDTQLNSVDSRFVKNQSCFPVPDSYVPYPVLNTQTGNIIYVQSEPVLGSNLENKSLSAPSMDSGMFSDVEYNIEVSERIKKWEKKITPAEMESKQRGILKTIQEYETFSDGNYGDKSVPDTPVEIRRELRQLLSPTDKSGLGRLSVSLTRSTSSLSDSTTPEAGPTQMYFEPKVVSSETNLHRIFRVVHEPKSVSVDRSVDLTPASSSTSVTHDAPAVQRRRKHSVEQPHKKHTQSLGNMAHSESELGNSSQQTWPPMSVDSDSGIRKSWRMSRYEDEINELKELVADNFRDLRKKFDSDVSEPDSRRGSSPARLVTITPTEASSHKQEHISVPVVLNVQSVTPTSQRSPIVVRRARTKTQEKNQPPPVSPNCPPLTPKSTRKPLTISVGSRATPPMVKTEPKVEIKPPDVWSPSMESGKGLISIERVKARTLQTIPFSEDPVWKEIEDLTTFDRSEETPSKISFDDIDALLELATKGTEKSLANKWPTTKSQNIMTTSFTPSFSGTDTFNTNQQKHRKLSDSALAMPDIERRKVFSPPEIQPLKLNATQFRKSSTSALDDVLEDIRASLQKKPLSPKLLKNVDTTESNLSPNSSLRSPMTKSSKAFSFPKDTRSMKSDPPDIQKESGTPGYDNTQPTWQQQQTITTMQQDLAKQVADMPYVDPEFTQFPYIINGNYHLDPDLLSEKLISTGLVAAHEQTPDHRPFERRMALFQSKVADNNGISSMESTTKLTDTDKAKKDIAEIDQSVVELKNLAQEVEQKLSQIKTRIVSADEGKLDSILLALRKFAPTTEQKYFNVNFTPSHDPGKIKRGKLENALTELEKIYDSLNLQDKSLMDRAPLAEEVPLSYRTSRQEKTERCNIRDPVTEIPRPSKKTQHRKSHIDEVERQTQNEFEDITKSFQVLLDEVTKQCRSVARGSINYSENEPVFHSGGSMQYSAHPPENVIHHEPPRQQLKCGNQSQRDIQDSYNTAIKELESVATGQSNNTNHNSKPVQSSVYLNLDSLNSQNIPANSMGNKSNQKSRSNGLNIKLQSREKTTYDAERTVPNNFVSVVTELKPTLATSVNLSRDSTSSDSENVAERSVVKRHTKSSNSKGRFRRKTNPEHRKSMPALMKTVETQTIETQTDDSLLEQSDKISVQKGKHELVKDLFTDLFREDLKGVPVKRKLSTGIAKMVDLFSSSEDEIGKGNKIKHSMSAPDIVNLFETTEKCLPIKRDKSDRHLGGNTVKPLTPKSVKNRHEAKSRFLSLQNSDANIKKIDLSLKSAVAPSHVDSASAKQDNVFDSPTSKPPVYPVWQYPGQSESPSPKKADKRPNFGFDRDFIRNVSDTEGDRTRQKVVKQEAEKVRRRTRSAGNDEDTERPRSFHELMAAFESDPERLEKIRTSGLRKCVSEESMFIDLVLQRMYPLSSFKENSSERRPSDTAK